MKIWILNGWKCNRFCHPKPLFLKAQKCAAMSLWQLSHIDLSSVLRVWLCDCSLFPLPRPSWWYLLITGSESAPCPHLHLITCLCLRTASLVIVMLASAEARRRSYRTQETPGHTDTLSPMHAVFSSIPSIQQRSALVCCAVFTAIKCLIFPENIAGYLILPAELHCITLYTYIYCLDLGIFID